MKAKAPFDHGEELIAIIQDIASAVIGLPLAEAINLAAANDMKVEVLANYDGALSANMDIRSDRLRVLLDESGVVRFATAI